MLWRYVTVINHSSNIPHTLKTLLRAHRRSAATWQHLRISLSIPFAGECERKDASRGQNASLDWFEPAQLSCFSVFLRCILCLLSVFIAQSREQKEERPLLALSSIQESVDSQRNRQTSGRLHPREWDSSWTVKMHLHDKNVSVWHWVASGFQSTLSSCLYSKRAGDRLEERTCTNQVSSWQSKTRQMQMASCKCCLSTMSCPEHTQAVFWAFWCSQTLSAIRKIIWGDNWCIYQGHCNFRREHYDVLVQPGTLRSRSNLTMAEIRKSRAC